MWCCLFNLQRKPSFWNEFLAMEWMCGFQLRLDKNRNTNCVKEVEVSSSLPLTTTGGKSGLCLRQMTNHLVLLWLNNTRQMIFVTDILHTVWNNLHRTRLMHITYSNMCTTDNEKSGTYPKYHGYIPFWMQSLKRYFIQYDTLWDIPNITAVRNTSL